MTKHYYRRLLALFAFMALAVAANAQTVVSGKVTDSNTGDPLPGVNIIVKGKVIGTITDGQGQFSLKVNDSPPLTLVFSFIGFKSQESTVNDANVSNLDIKMEEVVILAGEDIIVRGNYVEESIMKSPVSVEKVDVLTIRQNSAPDFYESIGNLKGVMMNAGSINFQAMNTRGFATIANTRFVQLIDGMDASAPILNFPTGNLVGIGELDAESMELIPGASSALWGPNAFNGILMLNSKSPFEYQGLSAQVKVGITTSKAQGESNPLTNYGIRYAKAFNNRFAFKINFYYTMATDWMGNDYKTHRGDPENPYDQTARQDFDGLNLYGDETVINVSNFAPFTRTGFKEEDLVDNYSANSIKGDIALHYRITDNLEAIYSYRYGGGNTVYQGSEKYAIRGFNQQFHKLELKSKNFWVRGYATLTDAGDSYNMSALGAYVNETYSPSETQWVPNYLQAMLGVVPGIAPGDPAAARQWADYGYFTATGQPENARPEPGTPEFKTMVETVRNDYFQKTPPGAKFIDDSRIYHGQFNYNLSDMIKFMELNVGGNFRRYSLFTDGTILNEDPENGSDFKRINIDEYGAYAQLAKQISKIKLTGSIRYDKNQNFDGLITPRLSAVFSINENSNIRASFQTGFRNPDIQSQYIYFPSGNGVLLGSTKENAERYGIHNGGSWTKQSFDAWRASGGTIDPETGDISGGDQTLLDDTPIGYIKPERLQSLEIGYKGLLFKKALVDFNIFYNTYNDFIGDQLRVSKEPTTHHGDQVDAGEPWSPYVNADEKVTSLGIGLGVNYNFFNGFTFTGNYTYQKYDADETTGFIAGFNTPNNKYNIGIGNRKISNSLPIGFNVNYRWQESYVWNSGFGDWTVPEFGVVDANISYKASKLKTIFKLGGTNLFGGDYRPNFGSSFVGQQYYLSVTFDQFLK
jgi:iron complex outermembrane recepter protein